MGQKKVELEHVPIALAGKRRSERFGDVGQVYGCDGIDSDTQDALNNALLD